MSNLTRECAIDILKDMLDMLAQPENVKKLTELRESNGNEMLKMMQFVFPVIMEIELDVVRKHGLGDGREALVRFAQNIRSLEREDPEIARLHNIIRSNYLPPVAVQFDGTVDYSTTTTSTSLAPSTATTTTETEKTSSN